MEIARSVKELREILSNFDKSKSVGFVPTMGALHKGHVSLIERAKDENDIVVLSIYVNKTQFLPGEDLEKYPRKEEADLRIARVYGVDLVFLPSDEEMYFEEEALVLAPKELSLKLEGAVRPGHFDGVLRVINKFFNLIKPTRAYFGKKDAQQVAVVKSMVKSFFMDTMIVPCEIIREDDGLAYSSRNEYLSEEDKLHALKLSASLLQASSMVKKGELDSIKIKQAMKQILEPLEVDYIAFVDREFRDIERVELGDTIILVAAKVGETRLIDNIWI